ncbi:kinase-like domain-containing protein [Echria macrotheca]|uniref:Kinase-like domain-containing protein n=1 Tax=Echria macrotheca TaxID=438768 RepID=A0AAJ0FEI4_9PEZI|nr:kinase-like domain-containing protein [Echria macrotheca]
MQIPFVDHTFDQSDPLKSSHALASFLFPNQTLDASDLDVKTLAQGTTNSRLQLFKVSLRAASPALDSAVLIKVYGDGTEVTIDRRKAPTVELHVHKFLAEQGLSSSPMVRFTNGHAYDFIPGIPCSEHDVAREEVWRVVARELGRWHTTLPVVEFDHPQMSFNLEPSIWSTAKKWLDAIPARPQRSTANKDELREGLSYLSEKLLFSRSPPDSMVRHSSTPVLVRTTFPANESVKVLGHGDLLSGNIIIQENTGAGGAATVRFIDYEHATYCPPAFELANHFAEWAGFECNYDLLPTRSTRREFIRAYLQASIAFASVGSHSREVTDGEVDELMSQVDAFRGFPGFYWQAEKSTGAMDFDYSGYAEKRLAEFWAWRKVEDGLPAGSVPSFLMGTYLPPPDLVSHRLAIEGLDDDDLVSSGYFPSWYRFSPVRSSQLLPHPARVTSFTLALLPVEMSKLTDMLIKRYVSPFLDSIGADVVRKSSRDIKLLILLRFIRLLGYGGTTFVLALYLNAIGFRDDQVGLFMTLTLVGDLAISFALTYVGDGMGVRLTAIIGALLMYAGGLAFAWLDNFWLLLLASVAGVINPSANEIDPFKAIEESAIARLSPAEARNDIFAWWTMLGMLGTAASNLLTGYALNVLQAAGMAKVDCYRVVFVAYAAMGILKLLCAACLSSEVEVIKPLRILRHESRDDGDEPLLLAKDDQEAVPRRYYGGVAAMTEDEPDEPPSPVQPKSKSMFTPSSFSFMWKLSLALAFDFIGSGLAQISWLTYFFTREYDIPEDALGSATFAAGIISSVLNLASSPLSRAFGQVQVMVICHTINSISLLMVSVPGDKYLALMIFMFRIITRELDNAPRQAFISAGVLNEERTSAMGVVNMVKTVGSCLGLYLTGLFAGLDRFWLAFMVAGALKLVYNVLIAAFFWGRSEEIRAEGDTLDE